MTIRKALFIFSLITMCGMGSFAKVINYPGYCGSWGYSPMDFNKNCHVDIEDLSAFVSNWLLCTDPQIVGSVDKWRPPHPPFPDIPISQAAPKATEWTRNAVIVQPWAKSQWDIIAQENIAGIPQELAGTYGFNAIILAPPVPHGYFVGNSAYYLTKQEIKDGITAYRAAGFKIIMYSSIVNCGHSEPWQMGYLSNIHPEWSQVDEQGGVITIYGNPWLCPNTGAFDYALGYTKNLITEYQPDAIMLDNSEFLLSSTNNLPTCYCASCQAKFKDYITKRFGDYSLDLFGMAAKDVVIPSGSQSNSSLYKVWQHWRNWTFGQAIEKFREQIYPTMLFANTAYLYGDWSLATDLQLQHEDVALSETRGLVSTEVSNKLILGRALSYDRPVWNYLGTFSEQDFTYLRPPDECARMTAATFAQLSCPWLVYYGFDQHDAENEPSRQVLAQLFGFKAQHPALYHDLTMAGNVGLIFSSRAHNYSGSAMIPPSLGLLKQANIPVQGIFDLILAGRDLSGFSVIVAENVPFLSQAEADVLVAWMQAGGKLIATSDLGTGDDIGGTRTESIIATNTGGAPLTSRSVGSGSLIIAANTNDIVSAVQSAVTNEQFIASPSLIEVLPYTSPAGKKVLHVVNHGTNMVSGTWTLQIPDSMAQGIQSILIYKPEDTSSQTVSWSSGSGHTVLTLPIINAYAIIEISY